MFGEKTGKSLVQNDLVNIAILTTIAAIIGIYLIATTVLISKDGVFYISQAQQLSNILLGTVTKAPLGYSYMIFAMHKLISFFTDSNSVLLWIYSAQIVSLLCRIFSLIFLYIIGKLIFGSRNTFLAILILIFLPYSAEMGSDALREWPHMCFLSASLALLLLGIFKQKIWLFCLSGLVIGLGYMIRPECAQVFIYAIVWIITILFSKKVESKWQLCCMMSIFFLSFAVLITPYSIARGRFFPSKLYKIITKDKNVDYQDEQTSDEDAYSEDNTNAFSKSIIGKILKASVKQFERIGELLMYFFILPWVLGICHRLSRKGDASKIERIFMYSIIIFNILILLSLHISYGYISIRHVLPLCTLTIFYIPYGLTVMSQWIVSKTSQSLKYRKIMSQYFMILTIIGLLICIPKLFRPIGNDKKGYRLAAKWLIENTSGNNIIAAPDGRITLYAQRTKFRHSLHPGADYIVTIVDPSEDQTDVTEEMQERYALWINEKKRCKQIVIYEVTKE